MNPIEEFVTKARALGEAARAKELEAKLSAAEKENAELKKVLRDLTGQVS